MFKIKSFESWEVNEMEGWAVMFRCWYIGIYIFIGYLVLVDGNVYFEVIVYSELEFLMDY